MLITAIAAAVAVTTAASSMMAVMEMMMITVTEIDGVAAGVGNLVPTHCHRGASTIDDGGAAGSRVVVTNATTITVAEASTNTAR